MSDSDTRLVEVEGSAPATSPETGLTQALEGALAALVKAGGGPPHLIAMQWSAPDPASIHPSRRAIDQQWRMVFAGFRPQPTISRSTDGQIHVRVTARIPTAAPPTTPVFRDYGVAELAREMSPRSQVPDMGAMFRMWTRDGAATRAKHTALDLAYGAHPDQRLDLYRPVGVARPPVFVFIHGGYWQASTKEQHAQFFDGMLKAGFAVANIEYGLAPETPLEGIVGQIREALHFLVREAERLDIDAGAMHVAGHSAGGYLSAMCACDEGMPPIRSAHLLSGIFDLEALRPIPMGPVLGITSREIAERLSPNRRKPRPGTRIGVAVGGGESNEFKRQSAEIAELWNAGPSLIVEGKHHFDLLDDLNGGSLLDQQLQLTK